MEDDEPSNWAKVGGAVARSAIAVGRSFSSAYKSIDPDLRRHAYQLPFVGLSLLVPRPRAVEALEPDGHPAVVCVHGLGGHPGNFAALKTYFAAKGRTRVYVVDFGPADSMEWMAYTLTAFLHAVAEENDLGPAQIDIVAHSMGGLITRLAAEDDEIRQLLRHVVTLGTPHHGSHLARLANTKLILDLRPDSDMMARLAEQTFWTPDETPWMTAIWSSSDTVVLPSDSAKYEGAFDIEIPGLTHYGYLLKPLAWRTIYDALQ